MKPRIHSHKLYTPNKLSNNSEKTGFFLAQLNKKLQSHIELNNLVEPLIQKHTSVQASVTRFENGCLDLAVENQSTANHLHYLQPILIEELSKLPELTELVEITTFVKQSPFVRCERYTVTKNPLYISEQTPQIMSAIASETIQHEGIRNQLLTLANNLAEKIDSE